MFYLCFTVKIWEFLLFQQVISCSADSSSGGSALCWLSCCCDLSPEQKWVALSWADLLVSLTVVISVFVWEPAAAEAHKRQRTQLMPTLITPACTITDMQPNSCTHYVHASPRETRTVTDQYGRGSSGCKLFRSVCLSRERKRKDRLEAVVTSERWRNHHIQHNVQTVSVYTSIYWSVCVWYISCIFPSFYSQVSTN